MACWRSGYMPNGLANLNLLNSTFHRLTNILVKMSSSSIETIICIHILATSIAILIIRILMQMYELSVPR